MLPTTVSLCCHSFKLGSMISTDDAKKIHRGIGIDSLSDSKTFCIVRNVAERTAVPE